MLTKNDCMSILVELERDRGINVNPYIRELALSREPTVNVLRFIAQNQGVEAANFYEMLRKRHNQKKSPLYTNILKEDKEEAETVTTLVCLLTQISLYGHKLGDARQRFFEESRAEEITRALNGYFKDGEIGMCQNLLDLIKKDLLVLEYLNGRRELE